MGRHCLARVLARGRNVNRLGKGLRGSRGPHRVQPGPYRPVPSGHYWPPLAEGRCWQWHRHTTSHARSFCMGRGLTPDQGGWESVAGGRGVWSRGSVGCLFRDPQLTAGPLPARHQATQSVGQEFPDPAGSADQAVAGNTARPACCPRPGWGFQSEIEADCPAAGQAASGLALGPGSIRPRKSQAQGLARSEHLVTADQTDCLSQMPQAA